MTQNGRTLVSPNAAEGFAKMSNVAIQQTSTGVRDMMVEDVLPLAINTNVSRDNESTANVADLPSDPVVSSLKNAGQSTPESGNVFLRPSKKVRKVGATKAFMFTKACDARGMLIGSPTDVETLSPLSFSTPRGKKAKLHNRRAVNQVSLDQIVGSSFQSNMEDHCSPLYPCEGKAIDDLKGSSFKGKLIESSCQLHLDGAKAEETVVIGLPSPAALRKKERHVRIEGVENRTQYVVERKRGRKKGSGLESICTNKEVSKGQTEGTQSQSYTAKEHQSLSMFPEKSDSPIVKDNGGTEVVAANNDLTISEIDCTQLSNPTVDEHQTVSFHKSNLPSTEGIEHEAGDNNVANVHKESTKLLNPSLEEHQTLPLHVSNFNPVVESNRAHDQIVSSEAISLRDTSINSFRHPQVSNEDEASNNEPEVVQMDSSYVLSQPVGRHETLSLSDEKSNPTLENSGDNQLVLDGEITLTDASMDSLEQPQSSSKDEIAKIDPTPVQENGTLLLGWTVEDHQNLSLCFGSERDNLTVEDNRDKQLLSKEAATSTARDPSMKSLSCAQFANEVHSSLSMEAREGERDIQSPGYVTTNMCSAPMQQNEDPLPSPPDKGSYPFIKSSPMWSTIESLEVFQLMPQYPHFRPLEKDNEELREGIAMGYMLSFANLFGRTSTSHFNDPTIMFENRLEALTKFEEHGFDVQPIRFRLEELLKIKDNYSQLDDSSKTAEQKLIDGNRQVEELNESIVQLQTQLQQLLTEKEMEDLKVAELQKMVNGIKESIQDTRLEFASVVAAPWK